MASALKNLSEYDSATVPSGKGKKFAVIVAEWNKQITDALAQGAITALADNGVADSDIELVHVPGTFELTYAAAKKVNAKCYDGVICLGCVIQGDTRHFDFICNGVTEGISMLNAKGETPVIFGVLTTDNLQQALDRAGGKLGNKGVEAGITALKMLEV